MSLKKYTEIRGQIVTIVTEEISVEHSEKETTEGLINCKIHNWAMSLLE